MGQQINIVVTWFTPANDRSEYYFFGRYEDLLCDVDWEKEIRWIEKFLKESNLPLSLCHNDIHHRNIIYDEENGKNICSIIKRNLLTELVQINVIFIKIWLCWDRNVFPRYVDLVLHFQSLRECSEDDRSIFRIVNQLSYDIDVSCRNNSMQS